MSERGFTVIDRRGKEPATEPCRVCGAPGDPVPHSREYGKPTMDCVEYLRRRLAEVGAALQSAEREASEARAEARKARGES